LRALRRRQNLTVEQLAAAVGVNKAHISRLERGLKTPSISAIARLGAALSTSLGTLMGETLDNAEIRITRKADIAPRLHDGSGSYGFTPLLHGGSVDSFEAFMIYPTPQGGAAHVEHKGHEMLYVVSGRIEVTVAGRTERLAAGDCIHFPGYLPHNVARVGQAQACALLVLSAR